MKGLWIHKSITFWVGLLFCAAASLHAQTLHWHYPASGYYGRSMDAVAPTGGANYDLADNNVCGPSEVLISTFTGPAMGSGGPQSGDWTFRVNGFESSGQGALNWRVKVYRYNGSILTPLFTSDAPVPIGSAMAQTTWTSTQPVFRPKPKDCPNAFFLTRGVFLNE